MAKKLFLGMTVVSGAETIEKAMQKNATAPAPAPAISTGTDPVQGVRQSAFDNLNGVRQPAYQVNGYRKY